ncbi:hypothetical protein CLV32_4246 [Pedobacter duraquae]|uniref:Uncharacterized protein n=1 Tax=Pedobacter duraquae TaxID=425511 RepID=A0A4R6IBN5_9SPHI|nr:hypothetical protein CLV32_4246 [Pedobacter duraquae]
MIHKMLMIVGLCISISVTAQSDDPGIPPGGDPDINEVPLDHSVWFLLIAGSFYGLYKVNRIEDNKA